MHEEKYSSQEDKDIIANLLAKQEELNLDSFMVHSNQRSDSISLDEEQIIA